MQRICCQEQLLKSNASKTGAQMRDEKFCKGLLERKNFCERRVDRRLIYKDERSFYRVFVSMWFFVAQG